MHSAHLHVHLQCTVGFVNALLSGQIHDIAVQENANSGNAVQLVSLQILVMHISTRPYEHSDIGNDDIGENDIGNNDIGHNGIGNH